MAGEGLLQRLAQGPVICAEGYLFELERRGYLQAGPYVPEVVLDAPEAVRQLHREFVRAGSDVVEAFTYYGHREKLKVIGKEDILEPLNRQDHGPEPGVRGAAVGRDARSAGRLPTRRMSPRQRCGRGVAPPQAPRCTSHASGPFPSISASLSPFG